MAGSETWAGWIRLGAILMLIVSMLEFFEGLIAIVRDQYYVLAPDQIVVFDVTTWGWITLLWSIVLATIGFSLLAGATWARWAAIVVLSVNVVVQLGFLGSARYPLWALTVLALSVIVLYALIVKWGEAGETIRRMAETRI